MSGKNRKIIIQMLVISVKVGINRHVKNVNA